jgi:hypothetical protein
MSRAQDSIDMAAWAKAELIRVEEEYEARKLNHEADPDELAGFERIIAGLKDILTKSMN